MPRILDELQNYLDAVKKGKSHHSTLYEVLIFYFDARCSLSGLNYHNYDLFPHIDNMNNRIVSDFDKFHLLHRV